MPTIDPVPGWNVNTLVQAESAYGTIPDPAGTAAVEIHDLDMGPLDQPEVRPTKDRSNGRDETLAFVQGRYPPIPFSLSTAVKTRATATTTPKESALLRAAGLVETVGGSDVSYALASNPSLLSLALLNVKGNVFGEHGFGGSISQLSWMFGDQELVMKVSGKFAGKNHLGSVDSASVGSGVATSVVLAAGEAQRFGLGFYLWESEVIRVTAVDTATETLTILRAQLSTSGAAHSSKAIYPYMPALTLAGAPMGEVNCTATLDGSAIKVLKGSIEFDTGIDVLPMQTGSARAFGLKAIRYATRMSLDLVLTREQAALVGKAYRRKSMAVSIACGTGAGGLWTFAAPYCEIRAFNTPSPDNDISFVTLPIAVRGNTGNDSWTLTYA